MASESRFFDARPASGVPAGRTAEYLPRRRGLLLRPRIERLGLSVDAAEAVSPASRGTTTAHDLDNLPHC
jgi:hypothetical protein